MHLSEFFGQGLVRTQVTTLRFRVRILFNWHGASATEVLEDSTAKTYSRADFSAVRREVLGKTEDLGDFSEAGGGGVGEDFEIRGGGRVGVNEDSAGGVRGGPGEAGGGVNLQGGADHHEHISLPL